MLPILLFLGDGVVHRPGEITDHTASSLGLTADDLAEMLPSGAMSRYRNRVLWALHYLKRADVVATPTRGQYVITQRGQDLLAEAPAKISTKTLERYPEYVEFAAGGRSKTTAEAPTVVDVDEVATPEERLQAAYLELQEHLAADVLDRLRSMDPLRFERVVLDVLTAMGYGGSDPDRASLTALSHDGGLDGVIKEDELGLDQVVVQAKRFNSPVDVKLVREFAGSLDEHGTSKGVFFTTDKFTGPATNYVRSIPKRIILIDGTELARPMVRHGVGISVTKSLRLARIDTDYFDPDAEV
jgi:restriction system protein